MAEKKRYLIEITYHQTNKVEEVILETDDLAWSMEQYQRNRLPFTWEISEKDLPLSLSHKMGKPFPTEESDGQLEIPFEDNCCGMPQYCSCCD